MSFSFASKFVFPKVYITTPIIKGPSVNKAYVTVYYLGNVTFRITADGGSTWENITLISGVRKEHNFSTSGTEVKFMSIGNPGSKIYAVINNDLSFNAPGIKIEFV